MVEPARSRITTQTQNMQHLFLYIAAIFMPKHLNVTSTLPTFFKCHTGHSLQSVPEFRVSSLFFLSHSLLYVRNKPNLFRFKFLSETLF